MELSEALKRGKVLVKFTKTNGEERKMICTTEPSTIASVLKEEAKEPSSRKKSDDVHVVFDLEKNEFRSFRKDSVILWEIL